MTAVKRETEDVGKEETTTMRLALHLPIVLMERKEVRKRERERVETSAKKSTSNMNSRACANKWDGVNRVTDLLGEERKQIK